ncbi:MAG: rod shape-determining protein [Bacteroidales bacterium]|jgi:rod shape-determining protein MreB|nr:rod shape-determining protein [Bacteroidales bacterium]
MGLFSFLQQDIAMDLGTANTIIMIDGKIVVDEPSIVAIEEKTEKLLAIGRQAQQMQGKTHEGIKIIRPLKDGVIADFTAAELMIRNLIKMANHKRFFSPSLRMVIGIPAGSTNVEIRAVRDSAEHSGGRDVYMLHEPMAAALGANLPVNEPQGSMIVDIGGGTTEIAVISLGGIVYNRSIRTAGDEFTFDIQEHMRITHQIKLGDRTSELIKINVGAAIQEDLDEAPEDYVIVGPHLVTSLPNKIAIKYSEIAVCLDKSLAKIENAIMDVLDHTPPELYKDICENGIFLSGGGALLRGLDKRISTRTNIPVHVVENPLHAVVRGTTEALNNLNSFNFLIR